MVSCPLPSPAWAARGRDGHQRPPRKDPPRSQGGPPASTLQGALPGRESTLCPVQARPLFAVPCFLGEQVKSSCRPPVSSLATGPPTSLVPPGQATLAHS